MSTTQGFDRITIEAGKMNGQPCIRGMRITVRRVLEALSANESREELFADAIRKSLDGPRIQDSTELIRDDRER